MLRPRVRIPLWAAVAIPAAAYGIRAIAWRSFRPDLPGDAIVLSALLVGLALYAALGSASKRRDKDSDRELDGRDDDEDDSGQQEEV